MNGPFMDLQCAPFLNNGRKNAAGHHGPTTALSVYACLLIVVKELIK